MLNILKLNFGTYISFVYLLFVIWACSGLIFGKPDALSGLGLLFLTAPWSFIILELANQYLPPTNSPVIFILIIIVCVLLNMAIVHLCGAVLSALWNVFLSKKV